MLFISTACLDNDLISRVNKLSSITSNIELSGGSSYSSTLLPDLLKLKADKDLEFLVHSYFPPPQESFLLNFADTSKKTRNFIIESMNYIKQLEIEYYSIHAGFKKDFAIHTEKLIGGKTYFSEEGISNNIDWFCESYSYKLAIENLYPNHLEDNCFFANIVDIKHFLDKNPKVYLLLDLGHLKISSRYFQFNYFDAVKMLFEEYCDRILEIHLSENDGVYDDHKLLFSDSVQYFIVDKYKFLLKEKAINVTLETRQYTIEEIAKCYALFKQILH